MDRGYEAYCFVDPTFYDAPVRMERPELDFDLTSAAAPDGWDRSELDDWVLIWPRDIQLPAQGWKIHASGCMENAEETVRLVWDYCVAEGLAFKFVRGRHHLLLRNAKYADRGSSGKLATIYPSDEDELEATLRRLGDALDGRQGPYILSDLRWRSGPLYVRYGGFAERFCVTESGQPALAIADPNGELVPDRRGPSFKPPPWAKLPEFLGPELASRNSATVTDLPYEIKRAIHFSNGGGLYEGIDKRDGSRVVLKEARPHAGLSMDGVDAVTRLDRERRTLERLSDLGITPAVKDYFMLGEHHFLALEFVDGQPLSQLIAERYPLALENPGEERLADYSTWVLDTLRNVEQAVSAIHSRGMAIRDLHPSNMLVQPDGRVMLIDFEIAGDVDDAVQQSLADPGFVAPGGLSGCGIDLYALACLRLFSFLPLTQLLSLDAAKADEFAVAISDLFPVPPTFLSEAVATIEGSWRRDSADESGRPLRPRIDAEPAAWPTVRESLSQAIVASATPQRDDRLFPGDVHQFSSGGLNMAYGAAGVLYALDATGWERSPEFEEWLVHRAVHPESGTSLGFYDGLHGVAWLLEYLGRRVDATKVLSICKDEVRGNWDRLGTDLFSGISGIGLALADLSASMGDPSFDEDIDGIARVLADRTGDESSVGEISGGDDPYAGLLRGSSGPALFFIRLYDRTGDTAFLDLAATGLRQDLRRCLLRDDGSLEVNEGWRTMPYLQDGSIGIGMVLDEYLARRADEQFEDASLAISRAARGQFYIEPGLFYGRAGMIMYLSRQHAAGDAYRDETIGSHIRRLNWHALSYSGHLAFPGEQLLRLSMDLGTGSAGVLLALGAALHEEPVHLPFVGPIGAWRRSSTDGFQESHTKGGE